MGYLRMTPQGPELVIAQGIGVAEVEVGSVEGDRLELRSTQVLLSPTAKPIKSVARSIWLEGDALRYTLRMALGDRALTHHLSASLRRVVD
jgi:hypothetical protein